MVMRYGFALLCLLTFKPTLVNCQDTLTLINGNTVIIKLKSYDAEKLVFSTELDSTANTQLPMSRVERLVLQNGTVVKNQLKEEGDVAEINYDPIKNLPNDVRHQYKAYKWVSTATLVTSMIGTPLAGLPVAIVGASTPPSSKAFNVRDTSLLRDSTYMALYKSEAYKLKKKKVWNNFVIGSVLWIPVMIIIAAYGT